MATRKSAPTPALPSASSLMRRLAEAAEALPYGAKAYVVADEKFPHTVYAMDQTVSDEIKKALRDYRGSKLYGPIASTPPTSDGSNNPSNAKSTITTQLIPDMWVHEWTSEWVNVGPPSNQAVGKKTRPAPDMAKVAAALGLDAKDARRIDAVAIGPAAYRKFVMPYLVDMYGLDEAANRSRGRR